VLAFFVIKIEQLQVVRKNSAKVRLAHLVSNLPTTGNSSVLTGKLGTKNLDFGLKNASEQGDKHVFLTETDSQTEFPVTHSKQTTASFLTETRIARFRTLQLRRQSPAAGALTSNVFAPMVRATRPGIGLRP
jgi:hypothetical protein